MVRPGFGGLGGGFRGGLIGARPGLGSFPGGVVGVRSGFGGYRPAAAVRPGLGGLGYRPGPGGYGRVYGAYRPAYRGYGLAWRYPSYGYHRRGYPNYGGVLAAGLAAGALGYAYDSYPYGY